MVRYSFYPKERNITLSPPSKKIAAACTNTPEKKPSQNYRLTPKGVEDKNTALLWHSLETTDKRSKYTYELAQEQCENLTFGARTWRLPTTDELWYRRLHLFSSECGYEIFWGDDASLLLDK